MTQSNKTVFNFLGNVSSDTYVVGNISGRTYTLNDSHESPANNKQKNYTYNEKMVSEKIYPLSDQNLKLFNSIGCTPLIETTSSVTNPCNTHIRKQLSPVTPFEDVSKFFSCESLDNNIEKTPLTKCDYRNRVVKRRSLFSYEQCNSKSPPVTPLLKDESVADKFTFHSVTFDKTFPSDVKYYSIMSESEQSKFGKFK